MKRRILGPAVFIAAAIFGGAPQHASNRPFDQKPNPVVLQDAVEVPMRDGVMLRGDLLLPAREGHFPTLVYRTPYGRKSAEKEYTTFQRAVDRGYAVLIQDVRGRYDSGGEFRPYENEGRDGFDTIEWAACQSWSNGDVGTFGLSYPGAVQWLAAVENPPHLKAMVPAMTFSTPQNFFYAGGTWDLSWIEWIWNNIAPDVRAKRNLQGPKTSAEAEKAWNDVGPGMLSRVPLNGVEEINSVAPYYRNWLSHPPEDPWWDWAELRNKYGRVHAAVLNVSAWYDDNYGPEGATTNFNGLLHSRSRDADSRNHLLIGPWVHGVDSTRQTRAGARKFGSAAAIDYDEMVLRWMDHFLRGINNGVEHEPAVRYFVMGSDEWREAKSWPPVAINVSYYLSTPRKENKTATLSMTRPKLHQDPSVFISDPEHPVENIYLSSGAHDYRELAKRTDVLTFDSETLENDTEVTGPIVEEIYLSCDCRDVDLWARLLDMAPDGTALNLMSPGLDVLRASYREPRGGRKLLLPNRIYPIRLESLLTSNVFRKGHRVRIQISGSFFPNFSRNPQTGDSERDSSGMKKARVSIYADALHASRIILPVVRR
jgi:uncharacterized protein